MIFYNKDISYGLALIRALPIWMADCVQQVQLNFLPNKFSKNLMLLHGVVIFLECFAIKTFLMEWLD